MICQVYWGTCSTYWCCHRDTRLHVGDQWQKTWNIDGIAL